MKALGFAAKTVFSAAFFAACGGTSEVANDKAAPASDDEIIAQASPCTKGLAKLKEVFPNGDKTWWDRSKASPELKGNVDVTECCESMLKGDGGEDLSKIGTFRSSGCCAADYSGDGGNNLGNVPVFSACTPWGPPVPPAMRRPKSANDNDVAFA
jgi:hypothetical protein